MSPPTEPTGPNAEQDRFWNDSAGPRWVVRQDWLDRQLAPLGRSGIEALGIEGSERILDVGCGCGETTLELAQRTSRGGSVVGIDLSRVMLERARSRAEEAGLKNVTFVAADAQTEDLGEAEFDLLYSRFGVMFFADPEVAFSRLRRSLRGGGRVSFVCWQAIERNPWMTVPLGAAMQFLPPLPRPAPGAPGPFSLADADRVRKILKRAGFEAIEFTDWSGAMTLAGGGLSNAAELFLDIGPVGAALREASAGAELRSRVADAVRDALAAHETEEGVRLPAATWIVTARA